MSPRALTLPAWSRATASGTLTQYRPSNRVSTPDRAIITEASRWRSRTRRCTCFCRFRSRSIASCATSSLLAFMPGHACRPMRLAAWRRICHRAGRSGHGRNPAIATRTVGQMRFKNQNRPAGGAVGGSAAVVVIRPWNSHPVFEPNRLREHEDGLPGPRRPPLTGAARRWFAAGLAWPASHLSSDAVALGEQAQQKVLGADVGGADSNGPVSTATASSFLDCPGVRCGTGWSSAWPERVVAVEGPLADLAASESPGLPGVPGPLQLPG